MDIFAEEAKRAVKSGLLLVWETWPNTNNPPRAGM